MPRQNFVVVKKTDGCLVLRGKLGRYSRLNIPKQVGGFFDSDPEVTVTIQKAEGN